MFLWLGLGAFKSMPRLREVLELATKVRARELMVVAPLEVSALEPGLLCRTGLLEQVTEEVMDRC